MALIGRDRGGAGMSNLPTPQIRIAASTTANVTASAGGAAVTLSFATVDGAAYSVGKLECGYVTATAGGYVHVTDFAGTGVYWRVPLTASGPVTFDLSDLQLPMSTGLKVAMGAGTGANVAYLNARPFAER